MPQQPHSQTTPHGPQSTMAAGPRAPFRRVWLFPLFQRQAEKLQRSNPSFAEALASAIDWHLKNPTQSGLRYKLLHDVPARRVGSSRVDQGRRMIHQQMADNELAALNVGDHDDMYAWA